MALGAQRSGIVRLVLSRVFALVGAGVLAGLLLSIWASHFVATLLYGIEPRDPASLAASVVILLAVTAVAAAIPASRASRIDPMTTLRDS
jgi:ABC-type antimicrobial peptide transport system permease subunit